MDDVRVRLVKCFQAVFPDLSAEEANRATPETLAAWDSVSTVTLMTLTEEEFGIRVPMEELDQFTSFPKLEGFVESLLKQPK